MFPASLLHTYRLGALSLIASALVLVACNAPPASTSVRALPTAPEVASGYRSDLHTQYATRHMAAAANPLAAQPFSRLGAVLHVAELLAAAPEANAGAVDDLPADVLAALEVDAGWMVERLPQAQRYLDASRLH